MEENYNEIVEDTKDDIFEAEIKANADDKITNEEEANISAQKSKKSNDKKYKPYSTKEKADYYFKRYKKLEKEGKKDSEKAKEFFRKANIYYSKAKKDKELLKENCSCKNHYFKVAQDIDEFNKSYQMNDSAFYDESITQKRKQRVKKNISIISDDIDKVEHLVTKYIYAVEHEDMKSAKKYSNEIKKIVDGVETTIRKDKVSSYEKNSKARCACDLVESSLDIVMTPPDAWEGSRKFMRAAMSILRFFVYITDIDKIKDLTHIFKKEAKHYINDATNLAENGRNICKDIRFAEIAYKLKPFSKKNEIVAKKANVFEFAKQFIQRQMDEPKEIR